MAFNKAQKAVIEHRRSQVARMRLRKMTMREIVKALADSGNVNPNTQKPWDVGTIHADIKAVEEEWKKAALDDTIQRKADVWAELQEVKRQGWTARNMKTVLGAIHQERALLGLDSPTKIAPVMPDGKAPYLGVLRVPAPQAEDQWAEPSRETSDQHP